MIIKPNQTDIDIAFKGTNFGPEGETPEGRRRLVAICVLQRACGFSAGGTLTQICKEVGVLTKKGNPKKHAKQWAFCFMNRWRDDFEY